MSKKSLFSALSRRARTTESSSTSVPATAKPVKVATTSATRPRRILFDDKSGPTPPRGSLTRDKLSYLDWRLQRINALRTTSERTDESWIDGRATIGRNSIDTRQEDVVEPVEPIVTAVAITVPEPPVLVETSRFYANEKDAAKQALNHALATDSIVASMPRLTKRGSSSGSHHSGSDLSGSEHSGSSDQHHQESTQAAAVQDSRADKVSFLRRASRRISMRPVPVTQTKNDALAAAPHMSAHLASQSRFSSMSSHSQRTASPLSRIWQRSA